MKPVNLILALTILECNQLCMAILQMMTLTEEIFQVSFKATFEAATLLQGGIAFKVRAVVF